LAPFLPPKISSPPPPQPVFAKHFRRVKIITQPTSPLYYYLFKTCALPQHPITNAYNNNKESNLFRWWKAPHRGQFRFMILLGLYVIYNMSGKKGSKKEEERLMELQRMQEEEKKQVEMQHKEERLRELAKKSTPPVR
jgi:amino acid permease